MHAKPIETKILAPDKQVFTEHEQRGVAVAQPVNVHHQMPDKWHAGQGENCALADEVRRKRQWILQRGGDHDAGQMDGVSNPRAVPTVYF